MLARLRKAKENGESGFTLIELLVVMIIIGILAAIAIPAFLNQRVKAAETAAKSDATNISKEFAAALVDGPLASIANASGVITITYADASTVVLNPTDYNLTKTNLITAVGGAGSEYCVTVQAYKDATVASPVAVGKSWTVGAKGLKQSATCVAAGTY